MQNYLIIVVVNLIVYFRTLKYGYVCDDIQASKNPSPTKNWAKNLILRLWGGLYWHTKELEHLTHTLLHIVNCSLIYWVFGANTVSLMAALLFSVNPANNQGSIHLSGRMYSRGTTILLIAFKFKLLFPILYLWGAFVCQSILSAPLMFLTTGYWYYIGLILIFLSMYLMGGNSTITKRLDNATSITKEISLRKLPLFVKTFTYYLRFSLFPYRLGFFHNYIYGFGLNDGENKKVLRKDIYFWSGLIVIPVVVVCILTNFMNTAIGLLWFCACISMWCNYPFTIQQSIAERYVYLPNVGLMLALANVFARLPYPEVLFFIFVSCYVTRLMTYMGAYKTYYKLLQYNLQDNNFKNNVTACILKGEMEDKQTAYYKALDTWSGGLLRIPDDSRLHYFIGHTLFKLGRYEDAYEHIKASEANLIKGIKNGIDPVVKMIKKQIEDKLEKKKDSYEEGGDAICVPKLKKR